MFFNVVFDTFTVACDWQLKKEDVTIDDDTLRWSYTSSTSWSKPTKHQTSTLHFINRVAIKKYFVNNNMNPEIIAAIIEKAGKIYA